MATGQRFVLPYQTPVDGAGVPFPGALLNFYVTNTSTRANTYANSTLSTPNTNPVEADGDGLFGNIFLDPAVVYKVVLTDSLGAEQWTADPVFVVTGSGSGGVTQLISTSGENLVAGGQYGFETTVGALSATLPQFSTVTPGASIRVFDAENNAGVNNITIAAFSGDDIEDFGTTASSSVISVSNLIAEFFAGPTAWRVIRYGGA